MTQLVRRTVGQIDPGEAARISRSKLVPEHIADDAASAEYMMRIGSALGIDPTSAFQHIYVFPDGKGRLKAGMSAHLMHALAVGAGHTLHVEGDAVRATAVLVRKTSSEELGRYRLMREEERSQKLSLLEDTDRLYKMQRQQILDRIEDLRALVELGGETAEEELKALRQQLSSLHGHYNFEHLREQITQTKFDLSKLTRFESVWTMKRASNIEGLTEKGTWQGYGPEMLKSRAKASVVRDGAIDVILGVRHVMADLGLQFDENSVDDRLAASTVIYTPEELGAEVDGEGRPLKGRVVDVTATGVSKTQDKMVIAAKRMIDGKSIEEILRIVDGTAQSAKANEDKISRLDAISKAVNEVGLGSREVPYGEEVRTLSAHLEGAISSLH
ncbi:hypothetical protein [Streptomyces cucumeris]|uniref:hypothetical protein n=1 Tax=Streptomyces cucumeris TaxID=2962890 RepID=UPI0020C8E08A|nr:hypothetical protein [Streptomyces sp. NEAU-Y11]MCP9209703.1 hypothetical protein [Streptomyces sp. NEAU-Y11]